MSIRAGRDLDMAGVLGRDSDTPGFLGRDSDTSGILGLFFAIIDPLSVPIPPENAAIVQKPPENAVGV
ncbi:MAG TPA: hypothetical protein K8W21_00295 [Enorma massiliensis]|uniref:hypothetical protein n=1 Tax=Enorma massiliensis TaxID=1472761 RepID=UPI001DBA4CF2|nr:hypothetical protein [Enorma massiliensis]HJG61414.1 hypothetical protein [Enorma massiliensis]